MNTFNESFSEWWKKFSADLENGYHYSKEYLEIYMEEAFRAGAESTQRQVNLAPVSEGERGLRRAVEEAQGGMKARYSAIQVRDVDVVEVLNRLHNEREYTSQYRWQPIETAPESGPFLVHGGMFRSESYADSKTREAVKVSGRAPYTMSHNKGEILFYVADADYHDVWVVNPTHWMPLPEAPQGEDR